MIRVGILGSNGRMGKEVELLIREEFSAQAKVTAQADVGDSMGKLLDTDVVIEFASPKAMAELATAALSSRKTLPCFIVGSTGWTSPQTAALKKLSRKTSVLKSANFSEGIFILVQLVKQVAPVLKKLGYQPFIQEIHHSRKKDKPSGTALSLEKALKSTVLDPVEIQSIRAGEVIGDHSVTFFGHSDRIQLSHTAQERSLFARGAIRAALWLTAMQKKNPSTGKLYGIEDYYDSLLR